MDEEKITAEAKARRMHILTCPSGAFKLSLVEAEAVEYMADRIGDETLERFMRLSDFAPTKLVAIVAFFAAMKLAVDIRTFAEAAGSAFGLTVIFPDGDAGVEQAVDDEMKEKYH